MKNLGTDRSWFRRLARTVNGKFLQTYISGKEGNSFTVNSLLFQLLILVFSHCECDTLLETANY